PAGHAAQWLDRAQHDLARPQEVRARIRALHPQIVVNAAAYTAVDAAEGDRDAAFAVNADGPAALAEACREIDAALVHFSTDYVFDGRGARPYREDDPIDPLSVYGASKAAGEAAIRERLARHVIIRTEWVYSPFGRNFVRTMLRLGGERERLTIVDDQHGSPTAAADIAAAAIAVCTALADGRDAGFGTFHFCAAGTTSWYRFAREIFAGAAARGLPTPRFVEPIASADYPTPATRPANSALDCGKIGRVYGIVPRPWQAALAECLDALAADGDAPRTGRMTAEAVLR
ncbi:MAG TPA: dTDP-4-dehydrorhamnose reductase, partial [Stellaceae bacterium]|nr:dTDP-4-dehydrorhamnose reductase [Stellaceae bacterium]